MKDELKAPKIARRTGGEIEWTNEHERRKRSWSEQERRARKERRRPAASEFDEMLAPLFARRMLS